MRNVRRGLSVLVVGVAACFAGYPHLSTSSQGIVTTNVQHHDFGLITVGDRSSTQITISPYDIGHDDSVTFIGLESNCPDFAVAPGSLPARVFYLCSTQTPSGSGSGSNCDPVTHTFEASFAPMSPGMQSCNVRIEYQPTGSGSSASIGGSLTVMLTGTGDGPKYAMEVSPTSLPFGDVPVNGTSTQPVTVKNTGVNPLTVSGTQPGSPFSTTGMPSGVTLNSGDARTINVMCAPTAAGPAAANINFSSTEGPTASVPLSCNGIVTTLNVSPSPAQFAYTLVGRAPADVPVTIANGSGSPTVMLSNFRFDPASSAELSFASPPPQQVSLGSSQSMQLTLRYSALTAHEGPLGVVKFDVDGVRTQNVAVLAEAKPGSIGTNPASLEFGPVCAGPAVTKDLKLYANAAGNVNITSVSSPSVPFAATNASGPLLGNHGNELNIVTTLTPATPGEFTDKMIIRSNLPMEPDREIAVHALVLAAGVQSDPAEVQFGPAMLNTTTTGRMVSLSNCGNGDLMVTGARVDGLDAGDFTIVTPADPVRTLAATEKMEFVLVMTPHTSGAKSAQLVIEHSGGSTMVPLNGQGYGGEGENPIDRETYYACSAGGAGGLPIAFALLALRRRRRR